MYDHTADTMTRRLRHCLRRHLVNTGLSVSDLSRRSGVRSWTIYRILDGRTKHVSLDDAARLCCYIESDLSTMLTLDNTEGE